MSASSTQPINQRPGIVVVGNDKAVCQTEMALQFLSNRQRFKPSTLNGNIDDTLFTRFSQIAVYGGTRDAHDISNLALCQTVFIIKPAGPNIGVVTITHGNRKRIFAGIGLGLAGLARCAGFERHAIFLLPLFHSQT
ncbi:hypothetical protein D3C80_455140 [compost metagenome]